MYERYWGLSRRPFADVPDAEAFIRTDSHHAALLKLRYLVEHRLGLGLIAGEVGTGKTTVAAVLERDLPAEHRPFVNIVYPRMTATELLATLALELSGEPVSASTRAIGTDEIIRILQESLLRHAEANRSPVVFIDEAHLLDDPEVLQALRLLLNFRRPPRLDFTLILSGDLTLLPQVQRMSALDDRVAVKCVLQPLTHADVEDYVGKRLRAAGAPRPLFDEPAIRAVFELSGGIPRRINRLCDLALLIGYADSLPRITEREIDAVAEELISVVPN